MSVYRIRRTTHYAAIPNAAIRDQKLSLQATGLLCLMLSYPDAWDFRMEHLIDQKRNGRDAFRNSMKELQGAGYVVRSPKQDEQGKLVGWEWTVTDDPNAVSLETRRTVSSTDGKSPAKKTERSTKTESPKTTEEVAPLPECVDPTLWAEYEKHRTEMRRKLTPTSRKRALALLSKHPTEANAMITRTLERGWTGLFAFSDADRRQIDDRRHADDAAAPAAYEEKPMEDLLGGRLEGRRR